MVVDCSKVFEQEVETLCDVTPVTFADTPNPWKLKPPPTDFSTEWPHDSLVTSVVLCACVTDTLSDTSVGTPMASTGTHDAVIDVTVHTTGIRRHIDSPASFLSSLRAVCAYTHVGT